MAESATHPNEDNPEVTHETSDISFRGVLWFAIGMIVVAIFIHLGVALIFALLSNAHSRPVTPDYPLAAAQENRLPPEPRLQPEPPQWRTPRDDLRDFRRQEDEILGTYGWNDKKAGVVRLPIDVAMKLAVQRGLPARENTTDTKGARENTRDTKGTKDTKK
jgi:hypothetical protein